MKKITSFVSLAAVFAALMVVEPAHAADQAQMMSTCNTYAARHTGLTTSNTETRQQTNWKKETRSDE